MVELCHKYNIHPQTFYPWRRKFVNYNKTAILDNGKKNSTMVVMQKEIDSLKMIIGEITVANETFKKTLEGSTR